MIEIGTIFAAVFGLILGSFFNVLIHRIPRGESIVAPGSHCPNCGRSIRPWENIPVLSYLLLRGKCAGCRCRIPAIYPLIEIVTAAATVTIWVFLVTPAIRNCATIWELVVLSARSLGLLILIPTLVIDLRHYIIPDAFTLPGIIMGLALSFLPGTITPVQSIIGLACGGGILLLFGKLGEIIFRKGEGMGGGDIKLMAFIGALWGWKIALMTVVFGSFIGAFASVLLIPLRLFPKDHRIPFGPFLAVGLWITVFRGDFILQAYFRFIEYLAG